MKIELQKLSVLILLFLTSCGALISTGNKPSNVAAPPPNQVALTYYTRGSYLLENGDVAGAEAAFKQALAADPSSTKVKAKLAEVYLRQNRVEEAYKLALEALPDFKNDPYFLMLIGGIELSKGDTESARKHLESAATIDPENDDILMLLWRVEAEAGRFDESISVLDKLASKYPDIAEIHYWLGLVKEAAGKSAESKAEFETALKMEPNNLPSMIKLGLIALRAGDNAAAEKYFRRVLDLDPQNMEALQGMAAIKGSGYTGPSPGGIEELGLGIAIELMDKGKFDEALVELQRLQEKHPDNMLVIFFLGLAYESEKDFPKAIDTYESIPEESSIYPLAQFRIAAALAMMKKTDEALRRTESLLQKYPGMVDAALLLANLYTDKDQAAKAIEILEPMAKTSPDDERVLYSLGAAYYAAGRFKESMDAMRKVLEINPENAEALNFIGYSLAERGERLDEAESLILKAMKLKPDSPEIVDSLGWVYFQQGKTDKAVVLLEQAYKLEPDDPTIAEHFADACLKTGKKDMALELYRKALGLKPKPDQAKRLKEKINSISKP